MCSMYLVHIKGSKIIAVIVQKLLLALAIIIIDSLGIKKWTTYIITALLFSILITTPLIFPNAYMPAAVRFGHSFELSTSMLTFGIVSVIILKNKLTAAQG